MRMVSAFRAFGVSARATLALTMRSWLTVGFLTMMWTIAPAVEVLVLSTGNASYDSAIQTALTNAGHTVTFGPSLQNFTGGIPANIQVVYIPAQPNWTSDMPQQGQQALVNWLNGGAGRGLITTEWVIWMYGVSRFAILGAVFPASYAGSYRCDGVYCTATYNRSVADPVLNNGLPNSFTFGMYGEVFMNPKTGATVYYTSDSGYSGVIGWELQSGARVMNLSVVADPWGDGSLSDANFARLLGNAVHWAVQGRGPCRLEGDVNGDGVVDDADLLIVLFNFGNRCE